VPKLETLTCFLQVRLVGERSICSEAAGVSRGGADRSENAGMSSDSKVRNLATESPRFPPQCKSAEGESALRVCLVKGA
jgi:hypothetical protein